MFIDQRGKSGHSIFIGFSLVAHGNVICWLCEYAEIGLRAKTNLRCWSGCERVEGGRDLKSFKISDGNLNLCELQRTVA